jgi:allophanate hydrolase subunit 1
LEVKVADRTLSEVLETLSKAHLKALYKALADAEEAEVMSVLSANDNIVVHYRRGRASVFRELRALVRATLESREVNE